MTWLSRYRQLPEEDSSGLAGHELRMLAVYNAERARGLLHTAEWQAQMAALQARYDEAADEITAQHARHVRGTQKEDS